MTDIYSIDGKALIIRFNSESVRIEGLGQECAQLSRETRAAFRGAACQRPPRTGHDENGDQD